MTKCATAILGIPVDNLTMETAVPRILEMVDQFEFDHQPRYVATINVDFITNILSWRKGRLRHPELMHILRRADMVTADGMPIVWASRWLGSPLPVRVAGSDLVPRLIEAAAHAGKSVYFLGGKRFEMTAYRAARLLRKQLPSLKVAGVDAPWVHTAGEALAQAEEEDLRIVEKINAAAPDILLIAFGNPKQEIWFDRNRHRLRIPVSVGVGATFDFMAGTSDRAPKWMREWGLEWLFRLYLEPRRLWKRYLVDFLKFGSHILPTVFHCRLSALNKFFFKQTEGGRQQPAKKTGDTIVCTLPAHVGAKNVVDSIEPFRSDSSITLDFSKVRVMDAGGIGTLARAWQQAELAGKSLTLYRLSPRHKKYLSYNLLADYFSNIHHPALTYTADHLDGDIALVQLAGVLDTRRVGTLDYRALLEDIGQRDCVFDMTDLTYIGSSGLMLMLNISKYILSGGSCFVICSPSQEVRQMFSMTDLQRLFVILPDKTAALDFIHEVRGESVS